MAEAFPTGWRPFFTGPVIKTDLLEVWLEKHGIESSIEPVDPAADEWDLSREVHVRVRVADYDRAWQLFYAEREDEI
ncbi:MAG TPA: hypothetical protein VMF06_06175 [Candidatus Limnocylindria bacterium]|jgi:hypothetical protein|nr:hypothetical protein [Candidatus Limnocylindria bacterium]